MPHLSPYIARESGSVNKYITAGALAKFVCIRLFESIGTDYGIDPDGPASVDDGEDDDTITICDWLWENPPLTHKDKYLEIHNSIIQSVIS